MHFSFIFCLVVLFFFNFSSSCTFLLLFPFFLSLRLFSLLHIILVHDYFVFYFISFITLKCFLLFFSSNISSLWLPLFSFLFTLFVHDSFVFYFIYFVSFVVPFSIFLFSFFFLWFPSFKHVRSVRFFFFLGLFILSLVLVLLILIFHSLFVVVCFHIFFFFLISSSVWYPFASLFCPLYSFFYFISPHVESFHLTLFFFPFRILSFFLFPLTPGLPLSSASSPTSSISRRLFHKARIHEENE